MTAWDGINVSNIEFLHDDFKHQISPVLDNLPSSLHQSNIFFDTIFKSSLYQTEWNLRFTFDHLAIQRNEVLAAILQPQKNYSGIYKDFLIQRRLLNTSFSRKFGHHNFDDFTPHITLGNFIDIAHGSSAKLYLPQWSKIINNILTGRDISYNKVSLFGFSSMANFFEAPYIWVTTFKTKGLTYVR